MKSSILITFFSVICLATARPSLELLGGNVAPPHAYPYLVYLDFSGVSIWHCTGTLITPNYVLTSAQCTAGAHEAIVTLGTSNIIQLDDSAVVMTSSEILTHEGYLSAEIGVYDNVGLVKLPKPVELNDFIKTVTLPDTSSAHDHINETARLVSWGPTEHDVKSGPLLYVDNLTADIDNCEIDNFNRWYVHEGVICFESTNGGACGDIGAPLLIDDVQIGVYSFAIQGCYRSYHTGFQRIAAVKDWIIENSDLEA